MKPDIGQIRGMFNHASAILTTHVHTVLTLALFNGWIYIFHWSGTTGTPAHIALGPLDINGLWLPSLTVCTLTLFIFFLAPRLCTHIGRGALGFATGCLAASTVLVAGAPVVSENAQNIAHLATGILSGVGTGIFTAHCGRLITRYDASIVLTFASVAILFSAICCALFTFLPAPVTWFALLAIAPILFVVSFRAVGQPTAATQRRATHATAPMHKNVPFRLPARFVLFLGLLIVIGLSGGLLRGFADSSVLGDQNPLVVALAMGIASVMLFFSHVPENGNPFTLFYRAIACIAAAFIILTLLVQHSSLALAIHTAGYAYSLGLLWTFCTIFAQQSSNPEHVFVSGFLAHQLGEILGAVALASTLHLGGGQNISLIANLMIYLLLFTVIILLARLSGPQAAPRPPVPKPTIEDSCRAAAERSGLTEREAQILVGLIKGYDRVYIARELSVSPETVKSHVTHIYKKLDVHSRVELYGAVMATPGEVLQNAR